jgi:hypothetical protein
MHLLIFYKDIVKDNFSNERHQTKTIIFLNTSKRSSAGGWVYDMNKKIAKDL